MTKARKTVTKTISVPLQAQGKNKKCTPQSMFDPAAGNDIYEPKKIIAERIVKGATQYPTRLHWIKKKLT